MSTDLFTPELEIEIQAIPDDAEIALTSIEPETEPAVEIEAIAESTALVPMLVEVLPADFPLPLLIRFVPDLRLKKAAADMAARVLAVEVGLDDGPTLLDEALTNCRGSVKAIEADFDEPTKVANRLHKRLTTMLGEWCEVPKNAIVVGNRRLFDEQGRRQAIADEARRKAQDEANRQAREAALKEAEAAAKQRAPVEVVEELKRQAETATAPPVAATGPPPLKGSSAVVPWKARLLGTPADGDPHPKIEDLSPTQRQHVLELLKAIVEGRAPLAAIDGLDWGYLDKRADHERTTMAIPGLEAFAAGGMRAKGGRRL